MKVLISFVFVCSLTFICAVDRDVDNSCSTPDHKTGNCVPVKECSFITDILRNQPITEEIKTMMQSYHCSSEGSDYEVCCPYKNVHLTTKCGRTIRADAPLEAKGGKYPWNVLLSYRTEDGPEFLCEGSLINRNYVLTTGHCTKVLPEQYPLLNVRLGEHDLANNEDSAVDIPISEVIPHPRFDPVTLDNNVGLLRLYKPANLSEDNIWPICLPHSVISSTYTKPGTDLFVSGWGLEYFAPKSNELFVRRYEIISNEDCQKIYSEKAPHIKIGNHQFCVRPRNQPEQCVGECGNAFYKWDYDIQFGIMSYGSKVCEDDNLPRVITKINPYMYWILDNLKL